MLIILRFAIFALIIFFILRFFSRTVDYWWKVTFGAFFEWVGVNGDLMMKVIIALAAFVTAAFFFVKWY